MRSEGMTRWMLGGFVALAGLLTATPAMVDIGVPARSPQPALYGVTWQGSLALVRVNPDTLRPVAGRRVRLAREPLAWSFAPDSSRLVLGSTARGARLRTSSTPAPNHVRERTDRLLAQRRRRFHLYGQASITGVQALGRKALVGTRSAIVLIDARTGRRLHRYRRFGMSLSAATLRSTDWPGGARGQR